MKGSRNEPEKRKKSPQSLEVMGKLVCNFCYFGGFFFSFPLIVFFSCKHKAEQKESMKGTYNSFSCVGLSEVREKSCNGRVVKMTSASTLFRAVLTLIQIVLSLHIQGNKAVNPQSDYQCDITVFLSSHFYFTLKNKIVKMKLHASICSRPKHSDG